MSANMSMSVSGSASGPALRRSVGRNAADEYGDAFAPGGAFAEDDGNPARGVLIGLLLSAPLWAVIGAVGYWVFR